MPIEDVQHLLRNSVQDSSMVFVDSTQRDTKHYPTPSEFVVNLDEPVRNVYGIDVLDAAISNTMYNVDWNNSVLRMLLVDTLGSAALLAARAAAAASASSSSPASAVDAMDIADLDALASMASALGSATPLRSWLATAPVGTSCMLSVVTAAAAAASPFLAWAATAPTMGADACNDGGDVFLLLVEERTATSVPLLCTTSQPPSSSCIQFGGAWYTVAASAGEEAERTMQQMQQMQPGSFAILPSSGGPSLFDVVQYRAVRMTSAQHAANFGSWGLPASGAGAVTRRFAMRLCVLQLELGNYATAAALQLSLQAALDDAHITATADSTSSSTINKQGLLRISSDANTRLLVASKLSSCASLLGMGDEPALARNHELPASARKHGAVLLGGEDAPMYSSVLRQSSQQLDSPVVINLLGVRYMTLRCAEIEQHLCSTGKYGKFSTGIGVFKLLGANEMVQVRLDFVNMVRRPFHPIAQLRRLTLRFELPDGSLYDFKGVDNQMLLMLKYYSPSPGGAAGGLAGLAEPFASVLNPDYDPDFMQYVARRDAFATHLDDPGRGSSDDDDDDSSSSDSSSNNQDRTQRGQGQRQRPGQWPGPGQGRGPGQGATDATDAMRRRVALAERAVMASGFRA